MNKYQAQRLGNYYAEAIEVRGDGRRFGRQVARHAKTQQAAMAALDATGLKGYVQLWVESQQKRVIVAERDEAGNWWRTDHFTGNVVAIHS